MKPDIEKLTKTYLDNLEPTDKVQTIWDPAVRGFGVRLSPQGCMSFIMKYDHLGRQRWIVLGRYGEITLDQARKRVAQIRLELLTGSDPAQKRKEEREAPTMRELALRFLEEHVEVKRKPTTLRQYRDVVNRFIIPILGAKPVKEVEANDISKLHHRMRETPYQANRALAVLSKMLQLAEVWGFRPMKSNPCYLIEKFKERPKERYLSEPELSRLGEVLAQVEREKLVDVFVVAAIRLLIFTGARVSEILNLQWHHVDLNNGTLRLPDSKTGAKVIFLSVPAANVLKKMPKLVGSPWVIPSEEPENPWVNINKPWLKIRELAKLEGVRIHDLRHTFASMAVQSGLSLEMVGGLLGHSQASTTKRYSHLSNRFLSTENKKVGDKLAKALSTPKKKSKG
nr:tyrosine-type recombinase/integrase [uncultured Holophaga sp.]